MKQWASTIALDNGNMTQIKQDSNCDNFIIFFSIFCLPAPRLDNIFFLPTTFFLCKNEGRMWNAFGCTNRDSRLTLAGPCSLPLEFPARIWRNLARGTHYLKRFPSKEYCSGHHLAGLPWTSTNRSSLCPCKKIKEKRHTKGILLLFFKKLEKLRGKNDICRHKLDERQRLTSVLAAPFCYTPTYFPVGF